jgi:hemerythrin
MTHEEMERTMQFILEQQAQFASNQQRLDENHQSLDERVTRLETEMANSARTQAQVHEVLAAMLETHRHTEEKLDAFIGVLERYISEGRNGGGAGGGSSD